MSNGVGNGTRARGMFGVILPLSGTLAAMYGVAVMAGPNAENFGDFGLALIIGGSLVTIFSLLLHAAYSPRYKSMDRDWIHL